MTSDNFYSAVREHLRGRNPQALADLLDLLDSGVDPEDLGDPAEYAEMVLDSDSAQPVSYGRVWDPANPSIFVRRVIGWGWDVNLAAVAVKLGWMRPDDLDGDVLSAVPERAMEVTRALPLAGAALTIAVSTAAAVRSDGRLPSGWDIAFRPNRFSGRFGALAPGIVISAGAAAWAARARDRGDQLARGVHASSLAFLGAGVSVLALRSTSLGNRPQPLAGIASLIVGPAAAGLAAGLIPVRAGLRAAWKEAGLHG
ncbi:DUF5808 domain-containing protein [Flaviflexus huanghaiensis]|uniref:DUF5808 domain-containing protein n=1 Tax=Flaviflexus huanghaiensis TaxID=1111473 RepID=UPI0015FDF9DC|nr:DUF5808 domain-containing protein [Flaviflexus huanghaiensis]